MQTAPKDVSSCRLPSVLALTGPPQEPQLVEAGAPAAAQQRTSSPFCPTSFQPPVKDGHPRCVTSRALERVVGRTASLQVDSENKSCVCGVFAEPSDGFEPETPSQPCRAFYLPYTWSRHPLGN